MAKAIPNWTNQSASQLRGFLDSPTGQDFLKYIEAVKPKISGDSIEKTALSAKVLEGYDGIVELIDILANHTDTARRPSSFVNIRDHARSSTQAQSSRPPDERPAQE
jgi:hypothetical protein